MPNERYKKRQNWLSKMIYKQYIIRSINPNIAKTMFFKNKSRFRCRFESRVTASATISVFVVFDKEMIAWVLIFLNSNLFDKSQ